MQDATEAAGILGALARFLAEQVGPAVGDPPLAFRVRIAASLAQSLALEAGLDAPRDAARRARDAELAARLRDEATDEDEVARIHDEVRRALVERLAIVAPRFDTRRVIE